MATSKTTTTTMPKARTSTRYLALRSSLPHLPLLCDRPQRSSKVPPLSPPPPPPQAVRRRKNRYQSSKNTAATGASSRPPPQQRRLQAKRKPLVRPSDDTLAMPATYTTPGEPGSFGGARRLFVGTLFVRREAQRYHCTQDAYTLHRQARIRFCVARHTRNESPTSTRQISSTCRVCQTSTTPIAIF